MTLRELLEYGKMQLHQGNIEESEIDAWYLLEHSCHIDRTYYLLNPTKEVEKEQKAEYEKNIRKRLEHIPLQYITGVQEFMGLEFKVNRHVLIPRQDTEVLVETVRSYLKPGMDILDMCTGSGCILISLLYYFKLDIGEKITGTGADISRDALRVAKENAEVLDVNTIFIESDLFQNIQGRFDIIVSNPPYIPTKIIEGLMREVKDFEPMSALDGYEDGLFFYKKIIGESHQYLKDKGRLFFEIGHDQGEDVSNLMKKAGFSQVRIIKDLAGLDRVVYGKFDSI